MKNKTIISNLLLFLTAAIWGLAFVAQSVGMDHVGPFTFNGVRFALGTLSLLPLIFFLQSKSKPDKVTSSKENKDALKYGMVLGAVLFAGTSLQQVGMLYTTAGKAAFITSLYIILVPIFGIFFRHRITVNIWVGSGICVTGLYLLSVTDQFSIGKGDILEFVGAFFWAAHILLIGRYSIRVDALKLSCIQCVTCSVLSLLTALCFETIALDSLLQAAVPILYGGVCSVGIAYTLQVVAQKNAKPSHAAIILSMENVFAALGGYFILSEILGVREFIGCAFMFTGILMSQIKFEKASSLPSINNS